LFSVEDNAVELAQLGDLVSFLGRHRKLEGPLDIVCMGVTPDPDSNESVDLVEQRADLGATWWLESLTPFRAGRSYEDEWPVDAMRERVLQGPPQLRGGR
jgi:hypothetical protein